jgi:hypothetical protein
MCICTNPSQIDVLQCVIGLVFCKDLGLIVISKRFRFVLSPQRREGAVNSSRWTVRM